jgi:LuxR family maltose regulon positive regulatory protein
MHMITDRHPQLLATKTLPPRGAPGLIARARLLGLVAQVQAKRLTLIKAAGGYGKTCLAIAWAEQLRRNGHSVAWLSLDADDDEPTRFLFYVAHVLGRVCGGAGESVIGLIQEIYLLRPHAIVTELINSLAEVDDEVFLFLDDYHCVTHRGIHDGLAYLLRHAPSNFHLVVMTRSEPPLPLATWRARNQLLELDGSALRFDLDETSRFLDQEDLGALDPAELKCLLARTEGWPAVMRIVASMSSQSGKDFAGYVRGLTGGLRPISAYLSEMLDGLADDMVGFMLRTSILERLTAPLCQAVTGIASSQEMLESIAARQLLLVPLDQDGQWYRCHPLLREHLAKRLEASLADEVPDLHRRAYRWYASHEFWTDAVQHATAVSDTAQAVQWIQNCAMVLVKRGDLLPLLGWQRLLPTQLMRGQLKVRLAIAWGMALAMRFEEALQLVTDLDRDVVESDAREAEALGCECQAIRAVAMALSDDTGAALSLAEACLARRPVDPSTANAASNVARVGYWKASDLAGFYATPWVPFSSESGRRNGFVTVYRLCLQGLVELEQLRPGAAEQFYLDAMRVAEQNTGPNSVAAAMPASLLAQIRYDQGRLEEAEDLLIDRMPVIDAAGMLDCVLTAYRILARIALHRANPARALALLDQAETLGHARHWGRLVAAVLLERLRLLLARGQIAEAVACLTRLERLALEHPAPTRCASAEIREFAVLARARLAPTQHRERDAILGLRRLHMEATAAKRYDFALRVAIQLAAILLAANESVEALTVFEAALRAAASGGLRQPVLDEAAAILPLLPRFREHALDHRPAHELLGFADDLIARCRECFPSEPKPPPDSASVDSLSPRERAVLELVGCGQSNKDIARTLSISPETVKSHVKNIFAKLAVERRAQAVSRAMSFGLVGTH